MYPNLDLKSAYHQVPISEKDKIYSSFETDGKLYQFCWRPFGVTYGVTRFQRIIDDFIADNSVYCTFACLDNITFCAKCQEEHDENRINFIEATKKFNLICNHNNFSFSISAVDLLGYTIPEGTIEPTPR